MQKQRRVDRTCSASPKCFGRPCRQKYVRQPSAQASAANPGRRTRFFSTSGGKYAGVPSSLFFKIVRHIMQLDIFNCTRNVTNIALPFVLRMVHGRILRAVLSSCLQRAACEGVSQAGLSRLLLPVSVADGLEDVLAARQQRLGFRGCRSACPKIRDLQSQMKSSVRHAIWICTRPSAKKVQQTCEQCRQMKRP